MNTQHYSRCCLGKSHRPQPRRWRKHCSTCRRKRPVARLLPHLLGLTPSAHPTPGSLQLSLGGRITLHSARNEPHVKVGTPSPHSSCPPSFWDHPCDRATERTPKGDGTTLYVATVHYTFPRHPLSHINLRSTTQDQEASPCSERPTCFSTTDALGNIPYTQLPKYIFNTVQAPFLLPMSRSLKETQAAAWRLQRSRGVTEARAASQLIH